MHSVPFLYCIVKNKGSLFMPQHDFNQTILSSFPLSDAIFFAVLFLV